MQRSLADLKREAKDLGLQVRQSGKRESKDDYIQALRSHFLQTKEMTPGLAFRLSIECPQLALNAAGKGAAIPPEELEGIMDSPDYAAEVKEDGARLLVIHTRENGFEAFGRNISVTDYLPVDYSDHIWLGEQKPDLSDLPDFVLDTEVVSSVTDIDTQDRTHGKGVVTRTQLTATTALLALNAKDSIKIQREQGGLKIHVFDCLKVKDQAVMDWPYRKRRALAEKIVQRLQEKGLPFQMVLQEISDKESFLQKIWAEGGEGIILKPLEGRYLPTTSRPRTGWLKVKRTVSGALGDTVDGFITGFEPGDARRGFADYVGALHVSVVLTDSKGNKRQHLVARVANIELELRKAITHWENGSMKLDPDYMGKVVEVEGQAVSGRAMRLTHPRLLRFREDKSPAECVMQEEALQRLVM